jgi:hypothetical protein
MKKRFLLLPALALCLFVGPSPSDGATREVSFDAPVDALSVGGDRIDADVSGYDGTRWSSWQHLANDQEDDPLSTESNLVMFDRAVSKIRLRGSVAALALHPIRVSAEPAHYEVAATMDLVRPRILSRSDWGADDSLLLATGSSSASSDTGDSGPASDSTATSGRVKDCQDAVKNYADEFRTVRTVTTDGSGHRYLWPQSYSTTIRLVVVHHTAMEVATDTRPAIERMRALYQYHAKSKGWGDIGYHYVIDENGQIYQGRAGGEYVVAGHTYCNNVGTIGVALMGNSDVEKPTQVQMKSLQWLLDTLGKEYNIDYTRNVIFHGKTLAPIVGHRELVSTSCPGYYVFNVLDQIRANVRQGNLAMDILFPPPPAGQSNSSSSSPAAVYRPPTLPPVGLTPLGDTTLTGRPGGEIALALQFRPGARTVRKNSLVASIVRGNPRINVWVMNGDTYVRARTTILAPDAISANQVANLRIKVQFPFERGSFLLRLGTVTYTLITEGKTIRTADSVVPSTYTPTPVPASLYPTRPTRDVLQGNSTELPLSSASSVSSASMVSSPLIRIRLHGTDPSAANVTVTLDGDGTVNGTKIQSGNVYLRKQGGDCIATTSTKDLAIGVVRIQPERVPATVSSWNRERNRYRGILECRIVEGNLTIINELPLDDYLLGLAEEPDSEPEEKQKAFAVAARTYAAYYLAPDHRKFPSQPYDASDLPSEFQVYGGVAFEDKNPRWVKVAQGTAGLVLKRNDHVIRAPYFSSDDGRTRSPDEVGWAGFPDAFIFASKLDPWCNGMSMAGHGVGMSGCGARGQAYEGKTYKEILQYYYPGTTVSQL